MRRALALLATALASGAAFGAAPFSHRVHLQLKLECVQCHAAAPSSTRASDNLLPDPKACAGCHRDAQVPANPPASSVGKFNHTLHLKLGNVAPVIAGAVRAGTYLSPPGDILRHLDTSNACQACHRGLESSDRVSHSDLPRMADCLVCHNQIDPPWSCEKCHDKGFPLKPASHTPDFLDTHTSGKLNLDKASCAACHGRRFTCLGCH